MAKEAKVTFESVSEAARAIEAEGAYPSNDRVRKRIGGSPNDIAPLLRRWHSEKPRVAPADIVIDQRIHAIIADQITNAVKEARAQADVERDAALSEVDSLSATGRDLEDKVEQLTAEVAQLTQQSQHDAGVIETLNAEVKKAQADAAAAVAKVEQEAAAERQRADKLVADLSAANVRLETLKDIKADLDRATAELRTEHDARIAAQAKADTIPGFEEQIQDLRATLKSVGEKLDAERAKLDQVRSEATAAIQQMRLDASSEVKALRETLEQRIEAERKRTADAEKATAAASSTAAGEKARADALAVQVADLTAKLAEKSKNVEGAKE